MKLCTFEVMTPFGPVRRIGVETPGGKILDVNLAFAHTLRKKDGHPRAKELANVLAPPEMIAFLKNGKFGREAIDEAISYLGDTIDDEGLAGSSGEKLVHALESIRLLSPIPRPGSIRDALCFEDHLKSTMASEQVMKLFYEIPALYYKGNPASVIGTETDVIWPQYSELMDYELEFAAVIGKEGKDITVDEAWEYIAGYTIFNDVSARDIQIKEMGSMLGPMKGKDMDGGNILGPYLVTSDEFDPKKDNVMTASVNDEEWSRGLTSSMYHDFADVISYISKAETLYPGDVIGSGTVGTGCGIEAGKFPKPGDVIELTVEGIGTLKNRFVKTDK